MPRLATPDGPPSGDGGSLSLLFTLRPTGVLGDQSDETSTLLEREDLSPGTVPLRILAEIDPTGNQPANISSVKIYVRASVADYQYNGTGPLLYANPSIAWGHPFSDEPQDIAPIYTPVELWSELAFGTRMIELYTDKNGNPWSFEALNGIYAGAYVDHVLTVAGVEGYLQVADVWVEVYGEVDIPIRRQKFSSGDYRLTIGATTLIASLSADEIREVFEYAKIKGSSGFLPLSLSALALDGHAITPESYQVNSTKAAMLQAIETARAAAGAA